MTNQFKQINKTQSLFCNAWQKRYFNGSTNTEYKLIKMHNGYAKIEDSTASLVHTIWLITVRYSRSTVSSTQMFSIDACRSILVSLQVPESNSTTVILHDYCKQDCTFSDYINYAVGLSQQLLSARPTAAYINKG